MNIYIYTYTHVYVYTCMYLHICIYMFMYTRIGMRIHIRIFFATGVIGARPHLVIGAQKQRGYHNHFG